MKFCKFKLNHIVRNNLCIYRNSKKNMREYFNIYMKNSYIKITFSYFTSFGDIILYTEYIHSPRPGGQISA